MDLRIGILGAARIAPGAVIKPARRTPGVVVAAIAARDPLRARKFAEKHHIPRVIDSYRTLIDDPDVDAVYNPLPNGLHGHWTIEALRAGKHVLCEKPFTANAEEARRVADVARDSPSVCMEAFHYRYHPLAERLAAVVASGELGAVRRIDVSFSAPLLKPGDIRYNLSLAGGALMDMGCYTVTLLRLLAGGEPSVTSAHALLSSPGVDRAIRAEFALPGDGVGSIRCSMASRSLLAMHAVVEGDEGRLRVWNPFAPHYGHRLRLHTQKGRRIEKLTRKPTYDFQLEAFVGAVNEGRAFPTTPDDAIATMTLIDAIYGAAGLEPRQPTPVTM